MPSKLTGQSLPNFMTVGAMKCGTSYVADVLRHHNEICFSRLKEPQYFTTGFRNSRAHFGSAFYAEQFAHHNGEPMVGEGSATYFADPQSAGRIYNALGPIKIVICLRDPVVRSISHYHHIRRFGAQLPPLVDLLEQETGFGREIRLTNNYATNIKRFIKHMGPQNVIVLLQEDLQFDPSAAFRRLTNFLSIGQIDENLLNRKVNEARAPKNDRLARALDRARKLTHQPRHAFQARFPNLYSPIRRRIYDAAYRSLPGTNEQVLSDADAKRLMDRLSTEISETEVLIGRDLHHWRRD